MDYFLFEIKECFDKSDNLIDEDKLIRINDIIKDKYDLNIEINSNLFKYITNLMKYYYELEKKSDLINMILFATLYSKYDEFDGEGTYRIFQLINELCYKMNDNHRSMCISTDQIMYIFKFFMENNLKIVNELNKNYDFKIKYKK